jgi:hypothetical protein
MYGISWNVHSNWHSRNYNTTLKNIYSFDTCSTCSRFKWREIKIILNLTKLLHNSTKKETESNIKIPNRNPTV